VSGASHVSSSQKIPCRPQAWAFSATAILPGEDPAAFKELHQKLIAELTPVGALEDHIVWTIARLVWRKKDLATLRIAELALEHESRIQVEKFPPRLDELQPSVKVYGEGDSMGRREDLRSLDCCLASFRGRTFHFEQAVLTVWQNLSVRMINPASMRSRSRSPLVNEADQLARRIAGLRRSPGSNAHGPRYCGADGLYRRRGSPACPASRLKTIIWLAVLLLFRARSCHATSQNPQD
jgi:hypothetical protein